MLLRPEAKFSPYHVCEDRHPLWSYEDRAVAAEAEVSAVVAGVVVVVIVALVVIVEDEVFLVATAHQGRVIHFRPVISSSHLKWALEREREENGKCT